MLKFHFLEVPMYLDGLQRWQVTDAAIHTVWGRGKRSSILFTPSEEENKLSAYILDLPEGVRKVSVTYEGKSMPHPDLFIVGKDKRISARISQNSGMAGELYADWLDDDWK